MNAPPIPPPLPNAPPTQPGALGIRREASWPKTLGVVCLVIGALGTVTNALGILSVLFAGKFVGSDPALAAHLEKWKGVSAASAGVGVLLAVMLAVVGIGMMSRRRWAAQAGAWWAVAKLIHIVVGGLLTVVVTRDQLAGAGQAMAVGMAITSAAIGALISAVLPVIVLVMLRREASREEIASWR